MITLGQCICITIAAEHGFGKPTTSLTQDDLDIVAKVIYHLFFSASRLGLRSIYTY